MLKLLAMMIVEPYIDHFINIWEKSPTSLPVFNCAYSETERLERENNFEQIQLRMKSLQSRSVIKKLKKSNPESKFFPVFRSFLQSIFDFEEAHLEIILSEQFRGVNKDFFYQSCVF